GRAMTYTALSYAARGLDREAGEHLGPVRSAQLARGNIVPAAIRNRVKKQTNQLRRQLADLSAKKRALVSLRSALEKQMVTRPAPPALPRPACLRLPDVATLREPAGRPARLIRAVIERPSS